jgi:hypothetical protein
MGKKVSCDDPDIDGACDLYDTDDDDNAACIAACTFDLWSHAKRECMKYLSAGDCDACDDL